MITEKIGIIGKGFVGNAVKMSFEFKVTSTVIVDIDPKKSTGTYKDLMDCRAIFVCVPSPMNIDLTCNTTILESVLENLKEYKGVIISKTTAPPSKYEELSLAYPNLVHCPEFLTSANAVGDYMHQDFSIIGGNISAYVTEAKEVILESLPHVTSVLQCSIGEAAFSKYAVNSFLATKVVFMNELYSLAKSANLDYEKIKFMISHDDRIGTSHMSVPGPDGNFGFAGACFPKDTSAFCQYANSAGVELSVLESAIKKNMLLYLTSPK
jgi:UDPglucose 6-dehydrogenase